MPASWDPITAVTTSPFEIELPVWSPCNRFIAISPKFKMIVDILDSATIQRLQSLKFTRDIVPRIEALAFSPDSCTLTSFVWTNHHEDTGGVVVSWDLRTGGVVSAIEWIGPHDTGVGRALITYLGNGRMVAVLSRYESSTTISIYDVFSGVYMYDVDHHTRANPDLGLGVAYVYKIWSRGESLRFATPEPAGITIWEVGLVPGATPMEIETVSIPDDTIETFVFKPKEQRDIVQTEFHPASCRLAFVGTGGTILVWDARTSKFLLHQSDINFFGSMNFSSDGRFFTCTTAETNVYLWKEAPTGYTLFEKLTTGTRYSKPRLSPNGQSIITIHYYTIQLWHTKSFTTATSCRLAQALHHTCENFILEFLPNRPLAVVTRKGDRTMTVFDLKSGVPQLTIDTSIEVYGLRPIGSTIVIIGDNKTITWNIPEGSFPPGVTRMNVKDSVRTLNLGNVGSDTVVTTSVSVDFRYIAFIRYNPTYRNHFLDVYCLSTGQNLRQEVERIFALWFAPGERDVWCANGDEAKVFTITEDVLNHTGTVAAIKYGSWGCPWGSSRGYRVTNEGWVLCGDGKRLLMLPPLWQSREVNRVWNGNGKFLALTHGRLPEVVILELEP